MAEGHRHWQNRPAVDAEKTARCTCSPGPELTRAQPKILPAAGLRASGPTRIERGHSFLFAWSSVGSSSHSSSIATARCPATCREQLAPCSPVRASRQESFRRVSGRQGRRRPLCARDENHTLNAATHGAAQMTSARMCCATPLNSAATRFAMVTSFWNLSASGVFDSKVIADLGAANQRWRQRRRRAPASPRRARGQTRARRSSRALRARGNGPRHRLTVELKPQCGQWRV
jgi:hypothetical protein